MIVSQFAGYAAWMFVPGVASQALQNLYYKTFYSDLAQIPQKGSKKYILHRKIAYVIVIITYLSYTIYDAVVQLMSQPNLYSLLGVGIDADEKLLRKTYRALSVQLHPDKSGGNEETFLAIKATYEILSNDVSRFGYDRFGRIALQWRECITKLDFITRGLKASAPHYAVSATLIIIFQLFSNSSGHFWRFYMLAAEMFIEVYLLTHSGIQDKFVPYSAYPFTIRDIINLSRQFAITITIALSHLGPVLFPSPRQPGADLALEQQKFMKIMIARLSAITEAADYESSANLRAFVRPLFGLTPSQAQRGERPLGIDLLRAKIQYYLIQLRLKTRPEISQAVEKALAENLPN
ncbi:hypothetical protein V1514DRAFT_280568 [Lipomyces japonicus]|uniref:uncharacterized protein n=1 Tax=Lipomyces japonicus TaxID=56871 RepID=UPI0034CDCDF2